MNLVQSEWCLYKKMACAHKHGEDGHLWVQERGIPRDQTVSIFILNVQPESVRERQPPTLRSFVLTVY